MTAISNLDFFTLKIVRLVPLRLIDPFSMTRWLNFLGNLKVKFPTAVEVAAFEADGGGVDMSLDDMSIEAAVHDEASFEVDEVAGFPVAEIGLFECLFDGGDAVEVVFYFFDGEANAVMGYALVDPEFGGDGGLDPECFIGAVGFD